MRSLDLGGENQRGKRWEEEINPKARGRRERETHRRLQPTVLLAGGRRLVAGDGERQRSCAAGGHLRASSRRVLAAGRDGLGQKGLEYR